MVRPGTRAEDREVVGRLVARAVAGGQPGQRADDLDVQPVFGDRHVDEIIGAARREHRIGGGERHEAFARQAGGGAQQQLLGHAHLVEAVGMRGGEDVQVGVFRQIGGHADDLGPVWLPAAPARGRTAPPRCAAPRPAIEAIIALVLRRGGSSGTLRRAAAASAMAHSSSSTRMKCVFSRVSRNGTPFPISVSQMMTRGSGIAARARRVERRRTSAAMSLPSTRCDLPAEGAPLVGQRLEAEHAASRGRRPAGC